MSNPERIDPERLAALIDGRLSAADAVAVRAELSNADDDTLMAFADASSIVGELESGSPVVTFAAKPSKRLRVWFWGGASVLAAAIVVFLIGRYAARDLTPLATTPAQMIVAVGEAAAPEALPWPVTRGAESGLQSSSRAVRLGVLPVDADALGTPDSVRRTQIEMAQRLVREIPGGSAISATMDVLSLAPTASGNAAKRAIVERRVMAVAGVEFAQAGAWLESARIALASGRLESVDRASATVMLPKILGQVDDASTRARIDSVVVLLKTPPVDARALQPLVVSLLSFLSR